MIKRREEQARLKDITIQKASNIIQLLEEELQRLRNQLQSTNPHELESKVAQLTEENSRLSQQIQKLNEQLAAKNVRLAELQKEVGASKDSGEEKECRFEQIRLKYLSLLSQNQFLIQRIQSLQQLLPRSSTKVETALIDERLASFQLHERLILREAQLEQLTAKMEWLQDQQRLNSSIRLSQDLAWVHDLAEGLFRQVSEDEPADNSPRFKLQYFAQYTLDKLQSLGEVVYSLGERLVGKRRAQWERGKCKQLYLSRAVQIGVLVVATLRRE